MGSVKDAYDILTELWDRVQGGKKLKKKRLAKYLRAIATLLDSAREKFSDGKVPRREGKELAITINFAGKLVPHFDQNKYKGLQAVFDNRLPKIGQLMRNADFFIEQKSGYSLHASFDRDDAKISSSMFDQVRLACHEMERVAGMLSAYALEFDELG